MSFNAFYRPQLTLIDFPPWPITANRAWIGVSWLSHDSFARYSR